MKIDIPDHLIEEIKELGFPDELIGEICGMGVARIILQLRQFKIDTLTSGFPDMEFSNELCPKCDSTLIRMSTEDSSFVLVTCSRVECPYERNEVKRENLE